MAKLHGPQREQQKNRTKYNVDIYEHPWYGPLARKWPDTPAPSYTKAWKRQSQNLTQSWGDAKALPHDQKETWKNTAQGGQKSGWDQMRSVAMAAPSGHYRLPTLANITAEDNGDGTSDVTLELSGAQETLPAGATMTPYTLNIGPSSLICLPTWIPGPWPICPTRRQRPRVYPILNGVQQSQSVTPATDNTSITFTINGDADNPPDTGVLTDTSRNGYTRILIPCIPIPVPVKPQPAECTYADQTEGPQTLKIDSYTDGMFPPHTDCSESTAAPWGGTLERSYTCTWKSDAAGSSISGKRFYEAKLTYQDFEARWMLRVHCGYYFASQEMWLGYKETGTTPVGTYTRHSDGYEPKTVSIIDIT